MVKIIADSTCDLSEELIKKYDISILPLHILLGEEEYEDGKTITPEEIFAWSDAHKTTPKTSAPGLEQALALIRPFVEEEREVICFSISDSMSTSGNVMRLAVEELHADGLVTVIDSENLSTGIGLLVVEAAQMAQEGKAAVSIHADNRYNNPFLILLLLYLNDFKSYISRYFSVLPHISIKSLRASSILQVTRGSFAKTAKILSRSLLEIAL